jgi:hypothetical protein
VTVGHWLVGNENRSQDLSSGAATSRQQESLNLSLSKKETHVANPFKDLIDAEKVPAKVKGPQGEIPWKPGKRPSRPWQEDDPGIPMDAVDKLEQFDPIKIPDFPDEFPFVPFEFF